jgi:hypothetical protein
MHRLERMELSHSKLQAAVQWINERRRGDIPLSMPLLVEDAARRFDLDLADQRELHRMFHA